MRTSKPGGRRTTSVISTKKRSLLVWCHQIDDAAGIAPLRPKHFLPARSYVFPSSAYYLQEKLQRIYLTPSPMGLSFRRTSFCIFVEGGGTEPPHVRSLREKQKRVLSYLYRSMHHFLAGKQRSVQITGVFYIRAWEGGVGSLLCIAVVIWP